MFNIFRGRKFKEEFPRAYKTDAVNLIYNLLFCDNLRLYKDNFTGPLVSPWSELFSESISCADLQKIIDDPSIESRVKIFAYNKFKRLGGIPSQKVLLGVVVEVGLDKGLDTLAAYVDRSVRYINYSEKIIIWEPNSDELINSKIDELFQRSEQLVSKIGPWENARLPQPKKGLARITLLVSDGLYFGQGGFSALLKDPLGGAVFNSASELMKLLIDISLKK